ncbi:FABP family protein [Corynebacterium hindlerae]|nr:FABP family protein [Corynebacterium hindlerae]
MHAEMGFLRPVADGRAEFIRAQPTGHSEILVSLDVSNVQNSSTAKRV